MTRATIAVCPRCRPPVIRRLDGTRITGWAPEALYVGFLILPKRVSSFKVPAACPECGAMLERRG